MSKTRQHWTKKVSVLVATVQHQGGVFTLVDGRVRCQNCPAEYAGVLRRNVYLVKVILKERQAAITWEREQACHCPARPFAHRAHRPADVWSKLKSLVRPR